MKRTLLVCIIVVLSAISAFAWPACNGNWVQVDSGSGPGFYTTGDHLTFQCKTQGHTCQGGHNCNNNTPNSSNSSSTSNSTSSASASSTSNSTSNATASQSQKQSQSQIATGGNATATGGNAVNEGNNQSTTYVNNQVRQAPPAFAPDVFSTAACRVGGSVGASSPFGGIALGGSKKDKDCERIAVANGFFARGNAQAGCKLLLSTKSLQGIITMQECLITVLPPAPVITQVAPAPPTPIVVVVPQPTPPAVVTEKPQEITVKPASRKKIAKKSNPCPVRKEK